MGHSDGTEHWLGVVVAQDPKRVTVSLGFQDRLRKLPSRQLSLIRRGDQFGPVADRLQSPPWTLNPDGLRADQPRARDVGAAWLLLQSSGESLSLRDWFELIYGSPSASEAAAGWLWLHSDQLWFSGADLAIRARPLQDLVRLRRLRHRAERSRQAQEHWHGLLRRREPLRAAELDPEQAHQLAQLISWASGNQAEPLAPALLQALRQAQCSPEPGAIRHLLVDLGQWDPHVLPSLQTSVWAHGFSAELEDEAQRLISTADQARPGDSTRVDRCGLHCVTIDDDDTQDLDDAIGLEHRSDGSPRIWIHVADPGRLIAAGDPLDLEAQRRGSSLYLARGILPMFPLALSCGPLSLRAGQRCAAWSLWVELEADGGIAAYGLERTWIKPTYRLSYADADDLIDLAPPQEADLAALHKLLLRRREWRERHGALNLDQPEGRVRSDGQSSWLEVTEPGPARQMVAEAMILAGAVVGYHGQNLGLALPYRSQLPGNLPAAAELQALPAGPVRHAAFKQGLSRGITSASPAVHFSLGLPAYVQATSPIRRYSDLIVQRQLEALNQGRDPLAAEAIQALISAIDGPVRQGIQISRDDQRHWRQVWFASHHDGQWPAQFLRWLRASDQLGLVWVESLAMELAAHCPASCGPGDALLLKVQQVDPLRDSLQLRAHR